ncbi:leucine zipper protein 2 isoform X1 [Takifugu rubripes]|uniref:Leucine zipper protein 2 n=1 Tax=Takifugu rubripes TaxID=31033 RepID=A0A3B5KC87_TAKRU|nr:leucine zipper protein 2 isoform X1 [Takifugu rubripes]|eukprot:XP_003969836.2 PREDICTED: leucine zipper protein 2 [Takifugu rubripes]
MKFIQAICVLLLCPALSINSSRHGYDGLEKKLKEVFSERTNILHQLSKTSKELDSIKGNLQTLKNDDFVAKKDVQRILELSHKQREEMKSLQAALQKQLDEANERAEKQQATIKFLKVEMEKKTKIIKDLQQENKSLKNKLLSGNKLCDAYAEESKKIQAQLKELRYGKKDLIFKGQQLMDLEQKLTVAKEELEKTALDKESQMKALKDTVHICFSAVLQNQPSSSHRFPASPTHLFRYSSLINSSRVTFQQPHAKDISKAQRIVAATKSPVNISMSREKGGSKVCQMEKAAGDCSQNQMEESVVGSKKLPEPQQQRSQTQTGKFNTKPSRSSEEAEGGDSQNNNPHERN